MANPSGHPSTLVAVQKGNQNRLTHGLYSNREFSSEAVDLLTADLMQLPHVMPHDRPAATEIARMLVQLDRVDAALADGKVERGGKPRALLDVRTRMHRAVMQSLKEFGATPAARAEWAARLAHGSLADDIRRRLEEMRANEGGM